MEVLTNHDKNSKKYHTRDCYQTSDSMVSEPLSELRRLGFVKCSYCRSIEQGDTGHTSDKISRMNPEDLGLLPMGERL